MSTAANGVDLAEVGLVVNASGSIAALDAFIRAADKATSSGERLEGSGKKVTRSNKETAASSREAAQGFDIQAKAAEAANRANRAGAQSINMVRNALAGLGIYLGARGLIDYADGWNMVQARLGLVTETTGEAVAVQRELFKIAQDSRQNFNATSDLYLKVARNAGELGRSQREILQFTEAVNKSLLLGGTSAQAASAGIYQLGQALASGRLQGDEFRSIMENMPELARAMAKGMNDGAGVSIAELRRMSREGELTANVIMDAVLNMQESIKKDAAEIPPTIGQALQYASNAMQLFIGGADDATGSSAALAKVIMTVADNLGVLIKWVTIATAGWIAYKVAVQGVAAWQAIVTGTEALRGMSGLVKWVTMLGIASNAVTPGGIIKLAAVVAAMAGTWYAFKKVQDEVEAAMNDNAAATADLDKVLGNAADSTAALTAEQERALKAAQQQRYANADMIRQSEQAIALAEQTADGQKRLQIEYDAVNKSIEARRDLQGALLQETLAAIETERRNRQLALSADIIGGIQEKELDRQREIAKKFTEDVQGTFTEFFEDIFTEGTKSFKNLFETVYGMFAKLVAQMASAELMKRWGTQLAGALAGIFGGVASSTAPAAAQGALEAAKAASSKGGVFRKDPSGELIPVQIAGYDPAAYDQQVSLMSKVMGGLAVAGAGYGAGQLVGSLTTNRGLGALGGAAAGAATGAMIGSVIPGIGTAVGAAVGGIAGFIGGLRASKKAAEEAREAELALAAFRGGMRERELRLQGRGGEADLKALEIRQMQELNEARKMSGKTTADLRRLEQLHRQEREQMLKVQAQERANAQEDLQMRLEIANGLQGEELRQRQLEIRQRREMEEAINAGRDANYLALLAEVHKAEAVKEAADATKEMASGLTTDIPKAIAWELYRQENATDTRSSASRQASVTTGTSSNANTNLVPQVIISNYHSAENETPTDAARKMSQGAVQLWAQGVRLRLPGVVIDE